MKYKCPQCGNEFVVHWYDNTHNFKCSQCEHPVFEQHKKRLRILNGFLNLLMIFATLTITRAMYFDLLGGLMVLLVVEAALISIAKIIEGNICKDLRVR